MLCYAMSQYVDQPTHTLHNYDYHLYVYTYSLPSIVWASRGLQVVVVRTLHAAPRPRRLDCRCLRRKTFLLREPWPGNPSYSRNCNPANDSVFSEVTFRPVSLSGGVFFSDTGMATAATACGQCARLGGDCYRHRGHYRSRQTTTSNALLPPAFAPPHHVSAKTTFVPTPSSYLYSCYY